MNNSKHSILKSPKHYDYDASNNSYQDGSYYQSKQHSTLVPIPPAPFPGLPRRRRAKSNFYPAAVITNVISLMFCSVGCLCSVPALTMACWDYGNNKRKSKIYFCATILGIISILFGFLVLAFVLINYKFCYQQMQKLTNEIHYTLNKFEI